MRNFELEMHTANYACRYGTMSFCCDENNIRDAIMTMLICDKDKFTVTIIYDIEPSSLSLQLANYAYVMIADRKSISMFSAANIMTE